MIIKNKALSDNIEERTAAGIGIITLGVTTALVAKYMIPLSVKSLKGNNSLKMDIANIYSNVVSTTYSLYRYYFGNPKKTKPAAVIAGIPLATVTEVSHALSDRILKFRATGGIFLAHQEGGETTLRIQGKAVGPGRYAFLSIMDLLFFYGSAKNIDLFEDVIQNPAAVDYTDIDRTTEPWRKFDREALDQGKAEKHLTFPVITRSKIYTNMYIETWDFAESVEFGMNIINFSIFFRKYVPHYPHIYTKVLDEKNDKELTYYKEDEDNNTVKSLRYLDMIADISLSASMYMYRFFQFTYGNSTETTVAHLTGLELNKNLYGEDYSSAKLEKLYKIGYDLKTFSIQQKEELMVID